MPEHDLKVRKRIYRAELGAYVLIVSIALFGFFQIEQNQDSICESVQTNRQVATELVNSVYTLGVGLITDDVPEEQLSPEQVEALQRLERFRSDRLETLGETEACE